MNIPLTSRLLRASVIAAAATTLLAACNKAPEDSLPVVPLTPSVSVGSQVDDALITTSKQHFNLPTPENETGEKFRVPFNASFDGNTVEMNVEQAKFGQVAAEYQATLNILENRVSGIRRALRGD